MKTHQLFCCLLTLITCCVFTCTAQTTTGIAMGYITVVISMAIFSKNILSKRMDKSR